MYPKGANSLDSAVEMPSVCMGHASLSFLALKDSLSTVGPPLPAFKAHLSATSGCHFLRPLIDIHGKYIFY